MDSIMDPHPLQLWREERERERSPKPKKRRKASKPPDPVCQASIWHPDTLYTPCGRIAQTSCENCNNQMCLEHTYTYQMFTRVVNMGKVVPRTLNSRFSFGLSVHVKESCRPCLEGGNGVRPKVGTSVAQAQMLLSLSSPVVKVSTILCLTIVLEMVRIGLASSCSCATS